MHQGFTRDRELPIRVIYIGGVPHNGSTIFSLALGNHPDVVYAGELSLLSRFGWLGDHPCSCGMPITDCPYWSSVREMWTAETQKDVSHLVDLEFAVDRNLKLPRQLAKRNRDTKLMRDYATSTYSMLYTVSVNSNKSIIVDSSKRSSRALALSSVPGIDLRLIHLIRDSRGVSHSWARPERETRRTWMVSSIRWLATNAAFELVKRRLPREKSLLVRYEDFTSNPRETLTQIGDFSDVDLSCVVDLLTNGEPLQSEHVGIGNRFLRDKKPVVLRSTDSWREKMPQSVQNNVWMLTSPMMRNYGYRR